MKLVSMSCFCGVQIAYLYIAGNVGKSNGKPQRDNKKAIKKQEWRGFTRIANEELETFRLSS